MQKTRQSILRMWRRKRQTFDQEFVEALAVGQGPDLFFLTQDGILKHKDKIYPIPFSVYSEKNL